MSAVVERGRGTQRQCGAKQVSENKMWGGSEKAKYFFFSLCLCVLRVIVLIAICFFKPLLLLSLFFLVLFYFNFQEPVVVVVVVFESFLALFYRHIYTSQTHLLIHAFFCASTS